MPLPQRVQLAVVAHIRHNYTNYDWLLNTAKVPWIEARRLVEQTCLDKVIEWRGEGDDAEGELEELFREVILVDDETDEEDAHLNETDRESSVEIIADLRQPGTTDSTRQEQQPQLASRAKSLEIISVKPIRSFETHRVLTREDLQRRMKDTRARVGQAHGAVGSR